MRCVESFQTYAVLVLRESNAETPTRSKAESPPPPCEILRDQLVLRESTLTPDDLAD